MGLFDSIKSKLGGNKTQVKQGIDKAAMSSTTRPALMPTRSAGRRGGQGRRRQAPRRLSLHGKAPGSGRRLGPMSGIDGRRGAATVGRCTRPIASRLLTGLPHPILVDIARESIEAADVESQCRGRRPFRRSPPTPAVNATGVLLHTNLGRAPLRHHQEAAAQTIEFDLALRPQRFSTTGRRAAARVAVWGRVGDGRQQQRRRAAARARCPWRGRHASGEPCGESVGRRRLVPGPRRDGFRCPSSTSAPPTAPGSPTYRWAIDRPGVDVAHGDSLTTIGSRGSSRRRRSPNVSTLGVPVVADGLIHATCPGSPAPALVGGRAGGSPDAG